MALAFSGATVKDTSAQSMEDSRESSSSNHAPLKLFREVEQPALHASPVEPLNLHAILLAKVHSKCHIVVDDSFYSIPFTLVGEEVEVHTRTRG